MYFRVNIRQIHTIYGIFSVEGLVASWDSGCNPAVYWAGTGSKLFMINSLSSVASTGADPTSVRTLVARDSWYCSRFDRNETLPQREQGGLILTRGSCGPAHVRSSAKRPPPSFQSVCSQRSLGGGLYCQAVVDQLKTELPPRFGQVEAVLLSSPVGPGGR